MQRDTKGIYVTRLRKSQGLLRSLSEDAYAAEKLA